MTVIVAFRSRASDRAGIKVKNWKVRWFVLEEESLHYYEKKDDTVPKGSINLVGAKLEKLPAKDKKFHFSVTPAKGGRTYFIYAANEEERESWMSQIAGAIGATEEVRLGLSASSCAPRLLTRSASRCTSAR